jgi:hypothetical protein
MDNIVHCLGSHSPEGISWHTDVGCWCKPNGPCVHSFCPHYDTYIKSTQSQLDLGGLAHRMESIDLPWGGWEMFPIFDFQAMILHFDWWSKDMQSSTH